MKRTVAATLLMAMLAAPAFAANPDAAVGRALDKLDYTYEVDEDGDYKMVFEMDDDRSQLVFVRSAVETFGTLKIREIWSPGYRITGGQIPASIANRLLEDSQDAKLGAWVKQDNMVMFVVKIDADAPHEQLRDAIDAASRTADDMELEITSKDDF